MRSSRKPERRYSTATEAALRRRTVVVWGDVGSGKSGFIGALRSEGAKSVGDRWTLDVHDATPDVIAYADSASLALRLRDVKEVPVRRPERAFTLPVERWAGKRATASIDLTVLDPQGTAAAAPADAASRPAIEATGTADGVLWLLEAPQPGSTPSSLGRVMLLRQIIAVLEAARRTELTIPVVVALTKIDCLPASEMRECLQDPERALRGVVGDAVFGWLLAAFPRLRCTAFSSAGTVRNAARPVGLTTTLDWFIEEWQREENETIAAETRRRRSARVARVRRRAPLAATIVAAAAIIAFAGVAAARLLGRGTTWTTSAGSVAVQGDTEKHAVATPPTRTAPPSSSSLASAVVLLDQGNPVGALRLLEALSIPDSGALRFAADSLIAEAAIHGVADLLSRQAPGAESLQLIVRATTEAIDRASPGTPVLAPLSLARAGACIGGRLACAPEQVREDLAWALLLGTPAEQDEARRLRAALAGDSLVNVP